MHNSRWTNGLGVTATMGHGGLNFEIVHGVAGHGGRHDGRGAQIDGCLHRGVRDRFRKGAAGFAFSLPTHFAHCSCPTTAVIRAIVLTASSGYFPTRFRPTA